MIVRVRVKPNSREEKIEKISEGEYAIAVKEPAEDNRANVRVINLLSKEFNTGYKNIKIKNPTSRDKIVEVNLD